MPTLLDVQNTFADAVFRAAPEHAAGFCAGEASAVQERLAIYRETAFGVLTTALCLTYPAVCRIVGENLFTAAAEHFIAQSPPALGYLNDYGAGFDDFLVDFPPAASISYLTEMARLEWAVNGALYAADAMPMPHSRLSELGALRHEHVRLVPHPSLRLLSATFPVEKLWRAVLDDDEAAYSHFDFSAGSRWLAISRTGKRVEVATLPESDWRFVSALADGLPLDRALAAFAPEDGAAALAGHFANGLFVDFTDLYQRETPDV